MKLLNKNNKRNIFASVKRLMLVFIGLISSVSVHAQEDQVATIKLSFDQNDSMRICKAIVISGDKPVNEVEVHFYVQRMYSLLPIGSAIATDSMGEAITEFPLDLPGDKSGNIVVVAKIEEDDNFGNLESRSEVKWGVMPVEAEEHWDARSLSAARDKAPMILILVSNLIIVSIWGTIIYVIYQVFRIKRESKLVKSKTK